MYHIVKDKSFSGLNSDPLRGIFYVRWERMDERHTLLYVVFVLSVLRAAYMQQETVHYVYIIVVSGIGLSYQHARLYVGWRICSVVMKYFIAL
jgi:hypothetical protein